MRHLLVLPALVGLAAVPASAETLAEAIALAYSNNPGIAAARARVRQAIVSASCKYTRLVTICWARGSDEGAVAAT